MPNHLSDSSEQRLAEAYMLKVLEKELGVRFAPAARLPIDLDLRPDAVAPDEKIVVEAYARVGSVRGGQVHKVRGDILKLAVVEKKLGRDWRKILCFASAEAARCVQGKSWMAEAVKLFNIEVCIVELSQDQKRCVVKAQIRQRMVNPS